MNGSALNAQAIDGTASMPMWLPLLPPRTLGRSVEQQTFLVPFLPKLVQQTRDVRDYDLDFAEVFPHDDPVTQASVLVDPAGLQADCAVVSSRVKVWLEGGQNFAMHKVTVVAHTAGGRAYEADIQVRIKDR